MKTQLTLCISGTLTLIGMSGCEKTLERPMNVVYILADDLGYGDVGCYGQQIIKTPNIDRMAKEGMLFTQHYAGCTVSAPSRCSLMTGLHTGHTQVRGNREITPEGQQPMREDTYTLGKLMKSAGYTTGIFGNGDWEIRALSPFPIRWVSMSFMGIIVNASRIPSIRIIYGIMRRRFFFLKTRTMLAKHIHKI